MPNFHVQTLYDVLYYKMTDDQAPIQLELPMPFPELGGDMPLLPARMVNEVFPGLTPKPH